MLGSGCLTSCLSKIVLVVLLLAAAAAGWKWGPIIFPQVLTWLSGTEETVQEAAGPSSDLAAATIDRIEALRRGEGGTELALSSAEIESVLLYSIPEIVPDGISEPRVRIADGVLTLTVRVAVEAFPRLPDLDPLLGFFPDTVDVAVEGTLAPLEEERREALVVHGVRAALVPLPDRVIPEVLVALGRKDAADLAEDAIAVPLPSGLRTAYILRDSLVLVSNR